MCRRSCCLLLLIHPLQFRERSVNNSNVPLKSRQRMNAVMLVHEANKLKDTRDCVDIRERHRKLEVQDACAHHVLEAMQMRRHATTQAHEELP